MAVTVLFSLTGCEGYYSVSGHVYETKNNVKTPLDSVAVKVYVGKGWLRGETFSDSAGNYHLSGLTSPMKDVYHIVFEKKGFVTDSIFKQGNSGQTIISYDQEMARKQ